MIILAIINKMAYSCRLHPQICMKTGFVSRIRMLSRPLGYSLVESLVAAAVLGAMFAGAISVVATMNTSERVSRNISVAYNYQDNAAKLWQLGLSPTEVASVMPCTTNNQVLAEVIGSQTAFGANSTVALSNSMGNLECVPITLEILNPLGTGSSLNIAQVYRPVYGTPVGTVATPFGGGGKAWLLDYTVPAAVRPAAVRPAAVLPQEALAAARPPTQAPLTHPTGLPRTGARSPRGTFFG